jgi:hypothetical protein
MDRHPVQPTHAIPRGAMPWPLSSLLIGLFSVLFIVGCSTQGKAPATPKDQSRNADDLLIIDCLLPGQVRRLGTYSTYLTARRPIKTSAVDCEIRGGEYVSFDRADYATALRIWLPIAESGDAEAQTCQTPENPLLLLTRQGTVGARNELEHPIRPCQSCLRNHLRHEGFWTSWCGKLSQTLTRCASIEQPTRMH